MLLCLAPVLVLAMFQVAVVALSADASAVWPAVSTMMIGQAVCLVAALACVVGLARLGQATDPRPALDSTTRALAGLPWVLVAALSVVVVVWLLIDLGAAAGVIAFALISAQAWIPLRIAGRAIAPSQ